MIKTVSFAPPRPSSSRSTGKSSSTPRPSGKRAASGSSSLPAQTSLDFSEPILEVALPAEVKPAAKTAPTPDVPTKAVRAKAAPKKVAVETPVAVAPPAAVETPAIPAPVKAEAKAEVKARKPRVPKDLATQYGENPTKRPDVPVIEPETPKKRLNKAGRDARRQLIKPDEGLLQRLARASQITVVKPKAVPRGKGWKFQCGRCGQTSYFETPGGLCPCGTIAVKE